MTNSIPGSEGENLSRIRDILFGEDLQSIEQKLDDAKGEQSLAVDELKSELEIRFKKIELLQEEKFKLINNNQELFAEAQKKIIDELKQEFVKINDRISTSIEGFETKFSNLEKSIINTIDELKKEHEVKLSSLSNNKLDTEAMADILNELATKLKK